MEMNPRSRTGTELLLGVNWNDYLEGGHGRYVHSRGAVCAHWCHDLLQIYITVQESSPRSPSHSLTLTHSKGVYSSSILPKAMSQPYLSVRKLTSTHFPVLTSVTQILVDGYISVCFGSQNAERYFACLLKNNPIPASRHSGRAGDPFLIAYVPQHIRDQYPNQNAWVLDRMVVRTGTVVPQTLWIPHTVTDRRNHVEEAPLQMPIFFQHMDGRLGLPLDVAISGRCNSLLNAQLFAPLGPQTTTYIRILVSGIYSAVVNLTFIESATTF